MSNLYKQQFVIAQNEGKRVINSNAIVTERLKELAYELQKENQTGENEFVEGIFPEPNENVIKQEDIDYVEMAKTEANQILMEAKEKADSLLNEAYKQSKQVLDEAKEKGYQDGLERQQSELEQLKAELEQEYLSKKDNLEEDYQEKYKNMENELVDVILEIFNKVFHIQFDNKKHILMYLIDDAILNIESDKKFRIRVANENVQFLENHKEYILDRVGHDVELEMIADSSMEGNECVIETESGVFDCSLGVQLENLIKDIRSLCS